MSKARASREEDRALANPGGNLRESWAGKEEVHSFDEDE